MKPRLRLFISADLIGSTALKQVRRSSEKDHGEWALVIQTFYIITQKTFEDEWQRFKTENALGSTDADFGTQPEVWKTIGDEILFVKEVTHSNQVVVTVECWLRALRHIREFTTKGGRRLDVKCTAWTAGFPLANKEVVVAGWGGSVPSDLEREYFAISGAELNRKYDGSGSVKTDYIGPAIDTGFRLSTFATGHRLVISIDLAYILAKVPSPDYVEVDSQPIYFGGSHEIKGLTGGSPYPLFWIDTKSPKLAVLETKLLRQEKCTREMVREYCDHYYLEYRSELIFKPFIDDKLEQQIKAKPPWYDEVIESYLTLFEQSASYPTELTGFDEGQERLVEDLGNGNDEGVRAIDLIVVKPNEIDEG